jgi:antitoxin YefM
MKTASYSELRQNLATMLDSVERDHAPIIITRDRGKPAAVLMSLEDFSAWEETIYLLRSPRNAGRLLEAVGRLDAGEGLDMTARIPEAGKSGAMKRKPKGAKPEPINKTASRKTPV